MSAATAIVIPDQQQQSAEESESSSLDKYIYPPEYEGHFDRVLIPSADIRRRVRDMAAAIHRDYAQQPAGKTTRKRRIRPLLICTLKGAQPFFGHLCDALQELRVGYDTEFVRPSSYRGTKSTGNVQIKGDIPPALEGRHVILCEDIVDTGTTLSALVPALLETGKAASVAVCTLLDKRLDGGEGQGKKKQYTAAKYVGFSIPNHFVVGYGLDYNELYRDLMDIYVISQAGIDFDRSELYNNKDDA